VKAKPVRGGKDARGMKAERVLAKYGVRTLGDVTIVALD